MSIIGGYFSFNREKMPKSKLLTELEHFRELSSVSDHEQTCDLFEYEFGHLFCIKNENARSLITSVSDGCNRFLSLGYLTKGDWSDWDRGRNLLIVETEHLDSLLNDIERLEGEFTACYYHASSQCLHVINDRFAARPLFFFKTEDGFFFCSNFILLQQLSNQGIHFDPLGLLQLFHFGHTIYTYTHQNHIKRLFPATHLSVSSNEFRNKQYWQLRYEPDLQLDHTVYAKEVFEAFSESTARRAEIVGKGTLWLSGGMDSRLIAATMPKDFDFTFCTFTSGFDRVRREHAVASEISKILEFEHLTTTIAPGIISKNAYDLMLTTGGLLQFQHCVKAIEMLHFTRSRGYDLFMDGGPGDVLVGSYIPSINYTIPSKNRYYCDRLTAIDKDAEIGHFFQKDFISAYFEKFQSVVKETMSQDRGPTAAHNISAWKMIHRQAPKTFANPAHSYPYATTLRPHLGYKYNDLILRLPATWLYGRVFYEFMIYLCVPELRNVINANTGLPLGDKMVPSRLPWINYMLKDMKRQIKTVVNRCKNNQRPRRNPFELGLIKNDTQLLIDMRDMLHSYDVFKDIFNIPHFMTYFDHIESGTASASLLGEQDKPIGSICGLLYFYKYFD